MPKTILVIEDDIDISNVIETVLNFNEFDVISIDRADNIFDLINQHNPDLILTDYMLPGMNGGKICQSIKENKNTNHIPVILMSAYHKLAMSILNFKYDAYLPKPFDINRLVKTIKRLT